MRFEKPAQLLHATGVRLTEGELVVESIDKGVEALVLQESLRQEVAGLLRLIDEQREEPLLLLTEVSNRFLREEAKEVLTGRAPCRRVGIGATTESPRLDEGVVVVVGERD